VNGLRGFSPVLVAGRVRGTWPGVSPVVVRRGAFREAGRLVGRLTGRPWQISGREARALQGVFHGASCRVVHIFFGDTAVHMLPFVERAGLPVVVSFHGADVAGRMASMGFRAARGRLFDAARLVACRSRDLAEQVAGLGCPEEKLRIMRTCLPPEWPQFHPQPPADGAWHILLAGRLIPKKGIATGLEAFARFLVVHPGGRLTIAGEGPLQESLETLACGLGISSAVRFAGFLSQEELAGEMAHSHIYFQPSETAGGDREGVPNALIEAMAAGLPPVATRHGGIPEALEHNSTGLLCPEADPQALAEALLSLTADPANYRRISAAAGASVRRMFSPAETTAAIETIYREAAGMPPGPA
jgi:colanic acid/amylovoran biosynthesis glycosyltransferase